MNEKKEEINCQFLHELSNNLNFEINEEECKNLMFEFHSITAQMNEVTKINTEGIEPLDYPFDLTNSYLRNDEPTKSLEIEQVLTVADSSKGNYITINKVIGEIDEN